MDPFQKEVIERLTRIETKAEALTGVNDRVTALERGEHRRNAIVAGLVAIPAAAAAIWQLFTRGTPA
jgi:hypothetical protein